VSRTAIGVAGVRARESAREDRLFDDSYARSFVAAYRAAHPDRPVTSTSSDEVRRALAFHVIIRTRFYDDWLHAAMAAGLRQVVILGAGLDARAYRLPWPADVILVEVDLPEVLVAKQHVLDDVGAVPRCDRRTLAADLRSPWTGALPERGFVVSRPTAWLAEGLLSYLDEADAGQLLTAVTQMSAQGSRLALERGDRAARTAASDESAGDATITSLWRGGLGDRSEQLLIAHGWQTEQHELARLAASYGRPSSRETQSGFLTGTYG
jgi:methyltransferase (TIGR00027 family)